MSPPRRILLWHGWVLEGSGSNIYTARTAEAFRRAGHEVLLLCQEPHPERFHWIDRWGRVDRGGVSSLEELEAVDADGSVTLLRPDAGSLLPVFVYDEYEGFEEVKPFVDLTDEELATYLQMNVEALRAAAAWFEPDAAIAGHIVPGAVIARRALGEGRYVTKVHGSDLEYAIKHQSRYAELAREGLEGARAVSGPSRDALARTVEVAPNVADRTRVVAPGVEIGRWRPLPRRDGLELAAMLLEADPDTIRGRPVGIDKAVHLALGEKDGQALTALAAQYDQTVPDQDAAAKIRNLRGFDGPLVGYLGKLIPQKGVDLLLQSMSLVDPNARAMIIGFGTYREWLSALLLALHLGGGRRVRWLSSASPLRIELSPRQFAAAEGLGDRVTFTGRLDHRYAPAVVAALDVLVVPSVLDEAFGMVAAEAAATGALPLVARHSGLAEVAAALEAEVGRPGLFSYKPGRGAVGRLEEGLQRLLELPHAERADLRRAVSGFAAREWTWERTADHLLEAAT